MSAARAAARDAFTMEPVIASETCVTGFVRTTTNSPSRRIPSA